MRPMYLQPFITKQITGAKQAYNAAAVILTRICFSLISFNILFQEEM